MRCADVLTSDEEHEGDEDEDEKSKKGDSGDDDDRAAAVKQLHLALLNPPIGAFMTTLDSVERVNLTIVNCTENQTPNVTGTAGPTLPPFHMKNNSLAFNNNAYCVDIHKTTELSTFALTGTLNMVGMVVNTRYLPMTTTTSTKPKLTISPSPRASIDDVTAYTSSSELRRNRLFVWLKEGKNVCYPPSSESSISAAKEKRPLDAFCEIKYGSVKYKTSIKKKDGNPKWFERFSLCVQPSSPQPRKETTGVKTFPK